MAGLGLWNFRRIWQPPRTTAFFFDVTTYNPIRRAGAEHTDV